MADRVDEADRMDEAGYRAGLRRIVALMEAEHLAADEVEELKRLGDAVARHEDRVFPEFGDDGLGAAGR